MTVLVLGLPGKGRDQGEVLWKNVVFIWSHILKNVQQMLTIKGEATEQSNFHLVPHFEECSASVTINGEFIFWEFHATLGTCHKRQS